METEAKQEIVVAEVQNQMKENPDEEQGLVNPEEIYQTQDEIAKNGKVGEEVNEFYNAELPGDPFPEDKTETTKPVVNPFAFLASFSPEQLMAALASMNFDNLGIHNCHACGQDTSNLPEG